jgi:hypothetical protein
MSKTKVSRTFQCRSPSIPTHVRGGLKRVQMQRARGRRIGKVHEREGERDGGSEQASEGARTAVRRCKIALRSRCTSDCLSM